MRKMKAAMNETSPRFRVPTRCVQDAQSRSAASSLISGLSHRTRARCRFSQDPVPRAASSPPICPSARGKLSQQPGVGFQASLQGESQATSPAITDLCQAGRPLLPPWCHPPHSAPAPLQGQHYAALSFTRLWGPHRPLRVCRPKETLSLFPV